MRILVTGGVGFIGSHVCEHLLACGDSVCVIDDLNSFYDPQLKRSNLAAIQAVGSVRFIEGDICDEALVLGVVQDFQPEAVVHLAALAGIRPSFEQPLLYEHVNIRGTLILLEACCRTARTFVFASSSSVYGVRNSVPFRVEDDVSPISPYAATKISGEKICFAYSHRYGIQTSCLRFFTVYGPRQRPDLAIRKFTRMILKGEPIPVFGTGEAARDYTYVEDIVCGIISALRATHTYEVFNLGNSHPVTLNVMIQSLERALGKRAVIIRLPHQPGEVPFTCADITKSRRLLGYYPKTDFEAGIQRFVEWYMAECAARAL